SLCATRGPPGAPLFPYTTLFRSEVGEVCRAGVCGSEGGGGSGGGTSTGGQASSGGTSSGGETGGSGGNVGDPGCDATGFYVADRSEEHTSELQSRENLVCRLLLE